MCGNAVMVFDINEKYEYQGEEMTYLGKVDNDFCNLNGRYIHPFLTSGGEIKWFSDYADIKKAQEEKPLKLEVEKTYITRDGDEVYIHWKHIAKTQYPYIGEFFNENTFFNSGELAGWMEDGSFRKGKKSSEDLIKEKE